MDEDKDKEKIKQEHERANTNADIMKKILESKQGKEATKGIKDISAQQLKQEGKNDWTKQRDISQPKLGTPAEKYAWMNGNLPSAARDLFQKNYYPMVKQEAPKNKVQEASKTEEKSKLNAIKQRLSEQFKRSPQKQKDKGIEK